MENLSFSQLPENERHLHSSLPCRSSWKTDRSKSQIKDLNQDEDPLPLIEDVLLNQEQTSSEMPTLEEPEKEAMSSEGCESDKKVEDSSSVTRQLCTPEERRHIQRERLNQILLNLLEKIPGKNGERSAISPSKFIFKGHAGHVSNADILGLYVMSVQWSLHQKNYCLLKHLQEMNKLY